MRIISGEYKSRVIKMVNIETTRETTDKVRGAIFNLISSYEMTGNVLDLFSGSGAMGLEALSRGATFAYMNDLNRKAFQITKENTHALGCEQKTKITNLDYRKALNSYLEPFQFVFLDPPYKLDCCQEIIEYIENKELLTPNGLIVCEVDAHTLIKDTPTLEIYKQKEYGIRKIVILRKR